MKEQVLTLSDSTRDAKFYSKHVRVTRNSMSIAIRLEKWDVRDKGKLFAMIRTYSQINAVIDLPSSIVDSLLEIRKCSSRLRF